MSYIILFFMTENSLLIKIKIENIFRVCYTVVCIISLFSEIWCFSSENDGKIQNLSVIQKITVPNVHQGFYIVKYFCHIIFFNKDEFIRPSKYNIQ